MAINNTEILALGAVVAGAGIPDVAPIPMLFSQLACGLYGAGASTYLRFKYDETSHPWTEWVMAILIGIGAGLIFGPSVHRLTGWGDGTESMVITLVAFAAQKLAEAGLNFLDAGAQVKWAKHIERVLSGIADALVSRFKK